MEYITSLICNRFGSKRGLLTSFIYKVLYFTGFFKKFTHLECVSIKRIVFICSGNICRSPFAEQLARSSKFDVISYGIDCRGGDRADCRVLNYVNARGENLDGHVTQNISAFEEGRSDLIVFMEYPQYGQYLNRVGSRGAQITFLGLWGGRKNPYIHDPFCANEVYFETCLDEIRAATLSLCRHAEAANG